MIDPKFFAEDKVFELHFNQVPGAPHLSRWRAFYRARPHGDQPGVHACRYRLADGRTAEEAVNGAVAGLITEGFIK